MAIRSFIAIGTPETIRHKMLELQSKLRESAADVQWEPQEKLHATIKFLGNVEEHLFQTIVSTAEHSIKEFQPFEIRYSQLGCFPNVNRPRVIWIGCENGDGTLAKLKEALDSALLPHGFEREDRKFHPHITLGRVKGLKNIKTLIPMLRSLTFDSYPFICKEILLMKSVLKQGGSEYSVLRKLMLS